MRFWDSSALTPLLVHEESTAAMLDLLRADEVVVAWWGTRVECSSAVRRRERERELTAADARDALARLRVLAEVWSEVLPTEAVRTEAERSLAVHPLRAADALQLAAAVTWQREAGGVGEFVCLDERLRDAAAREGLKLLP